VKALLAKYKITSLHYVCGVERKKVYDWHKYRVPSEDKTSIKSNSAAVLKENMEKQRF
jgi:hypothetical protein